MSGHLTSAAGDHTDATAMPVIVTAEEIDQLSRLLIGVAHWLRDSPETHRVGLLGYCTVAGALGGDDGADGLVDLVETWVVRFCRRRTS